MHIRLRTFFFVIVLLLLVIFAAINWPLFMQTSPINVLFGTVIAPLGVVMLAIVAGLTVVYLMLLARAEAGALIGSHRSQKELDEARRLAMNAEESRLHDLRVALDERLDRIELAVTELAARVDVAPGGTTLVREPHVSARMGDEIGR